MTDNFFTSASILFLKPAGDNQYLNYHGEIFRRHAKDVTEFDYAGCVNLNGIAAAEAAVRDIMRDKKIDVVFCAPFATEFQLSPAFFASLRSSAKVVFWMFDDEQYFDSFGKYYAQAAHAAVTIDYFGVGAYERLGVPAALYFSSHSKARHVPSDGKRDIDVSFVGDCTKNDRAAYIDFLESEGIAVETFGRGSKNGYLDWDDVPKIIARSKINLNFTKLDAPGWVNGDEPLLRRVRQSKGRPIEIALARSFCLSEYAPSFGKMFKIGKEADVFLDQSDLLAKIKFYLADDEEREAMASRAYARALSEYESDVYIPAVFGKLAEIFAERSTGVVGEIYLSSAFKIKTINCLTFSTAVMLKNLKLAAAMRTLPYLFQYGMFVFFAGFCGGVKRIAKNLAARFRQNA